jgi:hypothetical protein
MDVLVLNPANKGRLLKIFFLYASAAGQRSSLLELAAAARPRQLISYELNVKPHSPYSEVGSMTQHFSASVIFNM